MPDVRTNSPKYTAKIVCFFFFPMQIALLLFIYEIITFFIHFFLERISNWAVIFLRIYIKNISTNEKLVLLSEGSRLLT